MNTFDWHVFNYSLTYRLGDIKLGAWSFRVWRKVYSLNDLMRFSGDPEFPPLERGCDGYLLISLPRACVAGSIILDQGLWRYCLDSYQRCYIDLSIGFDAYRAGFSSKTRSGINRKIKKFAAQAGADHFRCYRTPEGLREFFRHARTVSAASYQERLLHCGLPADETFVANAMAAAARDEMRAFLLFSRGQPVSYLYCPAKDDVLKHAFLGFVPEFAKLSPGTVLQWYALEQLFSERRFGAFDFTEGEGEHKRFFSTHQTPCSVQLWLRRSWRARAALHLHRGINRWSRYFGGRLAQLGWKSRIKRWLRRAV